MCKCASTFPQGVIDQIMAQQVPADTVSNVTTITVNKGLTVEKTTTTDASGNITQSFVLSNQNVGTWRNVTLGASGQALTVSGTAGMRARIEAYTKPTSNGGTNTVGEKNIIRLSGTYGYATPVAGELEHIFTLPQDMWPGAKITIPIICYGVDLGMDVTDYVPGMAYISATGEVWAMFTGAVPTADAYAVEINTTFPTEA